VDEVRAALSAEVLVEGMPTETSDHLVIGPIGSDAGQPYLRRFDSKAVVMRFDKTDQHLAALRAQPNVLILTGGRRPSEYTYDAASAAGVTVLLSRTDTENTVIALEGVFDKTRFHGERKLERMSELLAGTGLFEALA
jgi:BioD-like phosphotransacetylase family protein